MVHAQQDGTAGFDQHAHAGGRSGQEVRGTGGIPGVQEENAVVEIPTLLVMIT